MLAGGTLGRAAEEAARVEEAGGHESFTFTNTKIAGDLAVTLRIDPQVVGINTQEVRIASAEGREVGEIQDVSFRFFYDDPTFGSTEDVPAEFEGIDDLNPGGWLHMGLAEYKLGHFEKGIKLLRTSLEMDPGQPLVYDWYFDFISKHRTREQQLQILKDLYVKLPYDSPTAQKITVDIYQIKRKLGIVDDKWNTDD